MTIIQLKYFLALAETLNFSQVAEQFYVAQTAISYSIKALETELGTKLFERTTKKVELTSSGHIFYSRVKSAVQDHRPRPEQYRAGPGQNPSDGRMLPSVLRADILPRGRNLSAGKRPCQAPAVRG